MIKPSLWSTHGKVALGWASGVTSVSWAVCVYESSVDALRVAAVANQLVLAQICQQNNGTLDNAVCDTFMAEFNKNFVAISTAIASGDSSVSINILPAASQQQSMPMTALLMIIFFIAAAVSFVLSSVLGCIRRRLENRGKAQEIDEINMEPIRDQKAPAVVNKGASAITYTRETSP